MCDTIQALQAGTMSRHDSSAVKVLMCCIIKIQFKFKTISVVLLTQPVAVTTSNTANTEHGIVYIDVCSLDKYYGKLNYIEKNLSNHLKPYFNQLNYNFGFPIRKPVSKAYKRHSTYVPGQW